MGKFRHIKQVIGNPPHNLSDFRIIIVGIGKPLQMCISISPHIGLHLGSHDMPRICHIEIGHRIDNPQHQVQSAHAKYHLNTQRRQIIHTRIRYVPHDHRQNHFTNSRQPCTE